MAIKGSSILVRGSLEWQESGLHTGFRQTLLKAGLIFPLGIPIHISFMRNSTNYCPFRYNSITQHSRSFSAIVATFFDHPSDAILVRNVASSNGE